MSPPDFCAALFAELDTHDAGFWSRGGLTKKEFAAMVLKVAAQAKVVILQHNRRASDIEGCEDVFKDRRKPFHPDRRDGRTDRRAE